MTDQKIEFAAVKQGFQINSPNNKIPKIQKEAAKILEGGKMAFIQRKEKYGF